MKASARTTKEIREICSLHIGEWLYGLPIEHIVEIVGGTQPRRVLLAPPFVGGIVHYRGDVLTAVSLRSLLGVLPFDGPQDLLVIEAPRSSFGLLVDKVGEVLTVRAEQYEANPSTVSDSRRRFFAGAYKVENSLLMMLDTEALEPMRLAKAS